MPWNDSVNPEDDRFHERNDDPWWNESAYLSFTIPEKDMMGMVYFWFRPNMGYCVGGTTVWDPSGEDIYNCRHWAMDTNLPIPDGAQMFDFEMENGLTLRTKKLQQEYEISYSGPGCQLELVYTAVQEPYYMRTANGQINDGIKDWAGKKELPKLETGHYEQAGRIRGTLTLDGETYQVDSPSLRDHTWGPRHMVTTMHPLRGGYPWAMTDEGDSFQLYATTDLTPEDDPIVGTTERVVSGWYTKDGVVGELVGGTRRCERGHDGRPVREIIDAVDNHGRELHAVGVVRTWLAMPCFSHLLVWWSLVDWEFDGHQVSGENQDYMIFRDFKRVRQALLSGDAQAVEPAPMLVAH